MTERVARCSCGAVEARCEGEPVRVSVCHCLNCKRRSGSAFAAQARFPADRVRVSGATTSFAMHGDEGSLATFRFCPICGATICYTADVQPDLVAIPIGAFADPAFPPPHYSVYENRMHAWTCVLGKAVEHD